MLKSDLITANQKLREQNAEMSETLHAIRQVGRDTVTKGTVINSVWIIEKVTTTLTKVAK